MGHPAGGVISNRYRYRAIKELKCPILILQWCKGNQGNQGQQVYALLIPPFIFFILTVILRKASHL
jgi:hypothetical protein